MVRYNWKPGRGLGKKESGRQYPIRIIMQPPKTMFSSVRFALKTYIEECLCRRLDYVYLMEKDEDKEGDSDSSEAQCDKFLHNNDAEYVMTLFEEEDNDSMKDEAIGSKLLDVPAKIGNYPLRCLIDTGSQVTAIAESTYLSLKHKINIPVIPISPMQIQGATNTKSRQVTKAALLPLEIGATIIETPCLIIKNLTKELILGIDWLEQKEAYILCGTKRSLKFIYMGIPIEIMLGETDRVRQVNYVGVQELPQLMNGQINFINVQVNNPECVTEKTIIDLVDELQKNTQTSLTRLREVLIRNKCVFSSQPGRTNKYQHIIKMRDEEPFVRRSYPLPIAYRTKVQEKLRELEDLGIIKREGTPYCSPLTCTLKKDGSIRILLDARELNKRMLGEVEAPPLIADILQSFNDVKFISLIDLNNAYFQIPLHPDSTKYTGFTFMGKSFTYSVLPQGLKTSVGSFSRAMDIILGTEVRAFCTNYLDDLVVFTKENNLDVHLEHLNIVLGRLKQAGITCGLQKCQFLKSEVRLLGHIVSAKGIKMDPSKIAAIKEFPTPRSVKHLRAFLGLVNYYRRFVAKYSYLTASLCKLLQKDKDWKWTVEEDKQFSLVKDAFLDCMMLVHPDPRQPYFLQTDSSKVGIAGCLYQLDNEGSECIIGFCSKGLTLPEQQWTVSEQELWAVIYSLKKFETYLRGSQTVIRTDHKSLSFINNWNLYSARVTRWILYIQQFDYRVEYIKGKDNIVPDILSRYARGAEAVQETRKVCPEIAMFTTRKTKEVAGKLKHIVQLQRDDPELGEIITELGGEQNREIRNSKGIIMLQKDVLMYRSPNSTKYTVIIPRSMQKDIIQAIHEEAGHFGESRIKRLVKDRYHIPNLTRVVKDTIRTCDLCQKSKHPNRYTVGACKAVIADDVGDIVMIDWYGPLPSGQFGMQYILVIQDAFSKFIQLYPTKGATTRLAVKRVEEYNKIISIRTIVSDNGSQFTSRLWYEAMEGLGIRISHTTVRNPRPNCTERVNRELGRLLRTYCHRSHQGWVKILENIERCYNNTIHSSTGYSPSEILHGRSPRLELDNYLCNKDEQSTSKDVTAIRTEVQANLRRNALLRSEHYNKSHKVVEFQVGDLVKLRLDNRSNRLGKVSKKFSLLYEGPYRVGGVPHANAYLLVGPVDGAIKGTYNAIHLERYYVDKLNTPR